MTTEPESAQVARFLKTLSVEEQSLFDIFAAEIKTFASGQTRSEQTNLRLLNLIPQVDRPSCLSLLCLSFLFTEHGGDFPVFPLLQRYGKIQNSLPESAKSGSNEEERLLYFQTEQQLKYSISTLPSYFFPGSHLPALKNAVTHDILRHNDLAHFIRNFSLPINSYDAEKPIVALAIPNGTLLGVALLSVTSYYTAVPISTSGGPDQFRSDAKLSNAKYIMVPEIDIERLGLRDQWVEEEGIELFLVLPNEDSTFEVRQSSKRVPATPKGKPIANTVDDIALVLFTSGTSGTKKVVPVTLYTLLFGVSCVIDSWGLTKDDCCLNMMPLNHV